MYICKLKTTILKIYRITNEIKYMNIFINEIKFKLIY